MTLLPRLFKKPDIFEDKSWIEKLEYEQQIQDRLWRLENPPKLEIGFTIRLKDKKHKCHKKIGVIVEKKLITIYHPCNFTERYWIYRVWFTREKILDEFENNKLK